MPEYVWRQKIFSEGSSGKVDRLVNEFLATLDLTSCPQVRLTTVYIADSGAIYYTAHIMYIVDRPSKLEKAIKDSDKQLFAKVKNEAKK